MGLFTKGKMQKIQEKGEYYKARFVDAVLVDKKDDLYSIVFEYDMGNKTKKQKSFEKVTLKEMNYFKKAPYIQIKVLGSSAVLSRILDKNIVVVIDNSTKKPNFCMRCGAYVPENAEVCDCGYNLK